MALLFNVIYATHANGTHHKLALDALNRLNVDQAEKWRRLFLKHAELYLQGSKAPDKEFKDFRNHVLHPGDEYWGGAPKKARSWYTNLVQALKEKNWSEAVWCAGVLSHYYTDPIHPFHTAQSDAESAIHRAVEWSISRSYNDLYYEGCESTGKVDVDIPTGDSWIEELVCNGADRSNRHYERLIAHYDINVGASDPPAGFDNVGRAVISELLIYATTGFARILDEAIKDANVEPPNVELTLATFLATLKIPLKWVLNKMDDAAEQAAVIATHDELMSTGRVDETLSDDDRAIRNMHAKEILEPRTKSRREARQRHFKRTPKTPQEPALSSLKPRERAPLPAPPPLAKSRTNYTNQSIIPDASNSNATFDTAAPQDTISSATTPKLHAVETNGTSKHTSKLRTYLNGNDELEQAPAIGPKTAARLATAGLLKVTDLLRANPEEIAAKVSQRHITAAAIKNWQDCARLVMEVPGLRGTNAQILAGAGFTTSASIAQADPTQVAAAVLRFAATNEGNRILRDGTPPDLEKITAWVESAHAARAA